MPVTRSSDAPTTKRDAPTPVRLRLDVYDAKAEALGLNTVESQAERHGIHRATMFRLRSGENAPSLEVAMRIAADLRTTVEALFERVA